MSEMPRPAPYLIAPLLAIESGHNRLGLLAPRCTLSCQAVASRSLADNLSDHVLAKPKNRLPSHCYSTAGIGDEHLWNDDRRLQRKGPYRQAGAGDGDFHVCI